MKLKESTRIALKISGIISFIFLLYAAFVYYLYATPWWILLAGLSLVFCIAFWVIRMYVERYIYDRIKLIYKMMHDSKGSANKNYKQAISQTTIQEVQQEVLEWGHSYEDSIHKLQAQEQYRKEYIGNISHELKTPLFTLLGYISTLLDGGLHDDSINTKYLIRSEKNINRLVDIVQELETISQLESGQLKLNIERCDIKAICDEVIEALEIKAGRKNVRIYYAKAYDKPIYVRADKKQIHRLLSNLMKNAIKYGFSHTGTIKISFFDMDDKVLTELADNGPGIAPEDLSRVFERFYRAEKGRSREAGGTGLGLAIVKHIAEAHQQRVYVRSSLGIGSTFGFTLQSD